MSNLLDTSSLTCEEANLYGIMHNGVPLPCGRKATVKLACERDGRMYAMCDMCAHHNKQRGMKEVGFIEHPPEVELPKSLTLEVVQWPTDRPYKMSIVFADGRNCHAVGQTPQKAMIELARFWESREKR